MEQCEDKEEDCVSSNESWLFARHDTNPVPFAFRWVVQHVLTASDIEQ